MASSSHPFMRRESNKRSFSTMAASHRDDTPDPFSDFHYDNEQSSRRRRLDHQARMPRFHYPGDGLDFRRPVMSISTNEQQTNVGGRSTGPVVIDLTDEDGTQEPQNSERQRSLLSGRNRAAGGPSRVQRLPRWGRQLVDSPSLSDEEDFQDTPALPGERHHFTLPHAQRPQFSSLRRPARVPSPPPEMDDDDIEVLTSNAAPRQRRTASRRSTPAVVAPTRAPRSLTPYPNGINETIDLTQDDDDDVVHLDTRQREGVNREPPIPTANVGTRMGPLGNIASILRDEGVNYGSRLMQRLTAFAGLDQEMRANQQAFDHYEHNHGHRHHHHHHHHRHQGGAPAAPVGNVGELRLRVQGMNDMNAQLRAMNATRQMPLMDYGITGFDLGIEGGGNRPPTPKYSPPPEPATGFTRSPEENEVVVCPNCGDELAMGDSDIKQEIWAIKSCGHVYCGDCAQNRSRGKKGKGKGKAPAFDDFGLPAPFSKCVIEDCGKPAGSKSMVLVYLGS